jgi:hypothetical protein
VHANVPNASSLVDDVEYDKVRRKDGSSGFKVHIVGSETPVLSGTDSSCGLPCLVARVSRSRVLYTYNIILVSSRDSSTARSWQNWLKHHACKSVINDVSTIASNDLLFVDYLRKNSMQWKGHNFETVLMFNLTHRFCKRYGQCVMYVVGNIKGNSTC